MAAFASSTSTKTSTPTELEALVALVARLSTATMDVVRLTAEVQAKLPAVVAGEVVAARAATAAAQAAQAAQAEATATDPAPDAADPLWVRGTPKTPAQLELQYPEGSGETWYVVICGREPGMYRTAAEADSNCNKVPNQLKAKKDQSTRGPRLVPPRVPRAPQLHWSTEVDAGVVNTVPQVLVFFFFAKN
ncbi:hypothetical protein B0H14DRAFT_2639432 [Mycena olivaceomarginata]|nr:hypothetical protein B0H14DRAFT_2639432 [Mycena olivaceomarginata]